MLTANQDFANLNEIVFSDANFGNQKKRAGLNKKSVVTSSVGQFNEKSPMERELYKRILDINVINKKGIKELKLLKYEAAEKLLRSGEGLVEDFKKFWYHNQKELGDLLECTQAYKCITLTFNNLGLMYKKINKYNQSAMYFK